MDLTWVNVTVLQPNISQVEEKGGTNIAVNTVDVEWRAGRCRGWV